MDKCKPITSHLASHFKLSHDDCPKDDKKKKEMKNVSYGSAVGSLMYAMVCTRSNIDHAVGVVSHFLSNPSKVHWNTAKWILGYLKGTINHCICFDGTSNLILEAYMDVDWAGDIDSRKSTSGYFVCFGNGVVSWQSKLQKCVALSTTEAEYIVITEACKELFWMKKFLHELGVRQERYVLFCDSQSAIHLSKNLMFHSRSKHIELRYHWIRDVFDSKELMLEKVHMSENSSDILTKAIPPLKLEALL
jgi:hypothetical protein